MANLGQESFCILLSSSSKIYLSSLQDNSYAKVVWIKYCIYIANFSLSTNIFQILTLLALSSAINVHVLEEKQLQLKEKAQKHQWVRFNSGLNASNLPNAFSKVIHPLWFLSFDLLFVIHIPFAQDWYLLQLI